MIFASDRATNNFHVGDPIDVPLEFRNQAALGNVDVHVDGFQLKPLDTTAPPISLQTAVSDLPQILAGQGPEIHLSGLSPAIRYSKLQHYVVALQATAKEGTFWPSAKIDSIPFEIVLWPDRMDEFKVTRVAANVVQVEIEVGSGVALDKGLRGQLTLISTADPRSGGIILAGASATREPILAAGPSGYSVKVQFQTGKLKAFHTTPVIVTIAFQGPLTDSQLKQLQASTKVVVA